MAGREVGVGHDDHSPTNGELFAHELEQLVVRDGGGDLGASSAATQLRVARRRRGPTRGRSRAARGPGPGSPHRAELLGHPHPGGRLGPAASVAYCTPEIGGSLIPASAAACGMSWKTSIGPRRPPPEQRVEDVQREDPFVPVEHRPDGSRRTGSIGCSSSERSTGARSVGWGTARLAQWSSPVDRGRA